jgi:thioredoxin reductase (NADPH)
MTALSDGDRQFILAKAAKLSFANKLSVSEMLELSAHVREQSDMLLVAEKDKKSLAEIEDRERQVMTDLDYRTQVENRSHHKTVIIGSGPAAFTAAIYAARANLHPIVFTGEPSDTPGGQLMTTTEIENYPGFVTGIHGQKLMTRMKEQSQHAGATVVYAKISAANLNAIPKRLYYFQDTLKVIYADTVIIGTGATAKKLGLPGQEEYWSNGVSACAVCDGPLPIYRNKELIVIGAGDTACEEASFLSNIASKVYMAVRKSKAHMRASKAMQDRVKNNPKIEIKEHAEVLSINGNGKKVTNVTIKQSGVESTLNVGGLFYAVGHTPSTQFLSFIVEDNNQKAEIKTQTVQVKKIDPDTKLQVLDQLKNPVFESNFEPLRPAEIRLDADGYIITVKGSTQCLKPKPFVAKPDSVANEKIDESEILHGVFACGDCQDKVYRQAVTAAGTGCMAALEAERYIGLLEAQEKAKGHHASPMEINK